MGNSLYFWYRGLLSSFWWDCYSLILRGFSRVTSVYSALLRQRDFFLGVMSWGHHSSCCDWNFSSSCGGVPLSLLSGAPLLMLNRDPLELRQILTVPFDLRRVASGGLGLILSCNGKFWVPLDLQHGTQGSTRALLGISGFLLVWVVLRIFLEL